jgi:hypothetical protein
MMYELGRIWKETAIIIIFIIVYLTADGFLPGCSGYTVRHNKQITHITQNNTTIKRNTAHKATHNKGHTTQNAYNNHSYNGLKQGTVPEFAQRD